MCIRDSAGYVYVTTANVNTGGGSTFTGIPLVILTTTRDYALSEVKIDLVVQSLNRSPETAVVTI